ncbi:MAG: hypothetical protein FWH11_02240 [Micrococcales bacterium]|nr:hypothetical protein [Micrococcales bacterium]
MGDGTTITCSGANAAGTPYDGAYGAGPSPTCGHRYTKTSAHQPGLAYTVSVTANWEVRWSGAGQSGTIPLQVRRTTQLRVGEVQVIITDRGPGPG